MRHCTIIFALVACSIAAAVFAQQQPSKPAAPQGSEVPVFKTGVQEVIVPVTVTDDKGRFVSDLEQKDFTILDEGRPQNITYFTRDRGQPVVVGFLVDQSNAVKLNWKTYMEATTDLVLTLMPDKKFSGYLIGYGNEAQLVVNTTHDTDKIITKLQKMKPGGGSSLYDAIYQACTSRDLVKGEPLEPRRIIVIVGDGHDNSSKHTLDQVIELAQRKQFTVYAVSTTGYGFTSEGDAGLKRITDETGGRVEYPLQDVYKDVSGYLSTPSDEGNYALKVGTGGYAAAIASGIYKSIAAVTGEITTQYIIRYIPETTDKTADLLFHRLEVKVNLPNVKVRARPRYFPRDLQ